MRRQVGSVHYAARKNVIESLKQIKNPNELENFYASETFTEQGELDRNFEYIKHDPDLYNLKEEPDFIALLQGK